jgi:hypothetical protein
MDANQEKLFLKLVNVLLQMQELSFHLISLLKQENIFLIENKSIELNEVVEEKDLALYKLAKLDQEKTTLAFQILNFNKVEKSEDVSLSDLYIILTDLQKNKLLQIRKDLEENFIKIKLYNEKNNLLAQSALNTIRGQLDEIRGYVLPKKTYSRSGDISKKQNPGSLVTVEL